MSAAERPGAWPTARKLAWIEGLGRDPGLSALALRLGLILATKYVNSDTGDAWPGQDTLAADLGATPDGLRKAAHQLEARGHFAVTRSPGRGRSNRYRPLGEAGVKVENPSRSSGLSGEKPPTGVRGIAAKPPTPVAKTPDTRPLKPPTRVGLTPFEEPLEEPSEGREAGKRRSATKRETPIPAGFPDDEAINREQGFLRREGWNIDARLEAASFRAHAETHDRRVKVWPAAFHQWILIAVRRAPPSAKVAPQSTADRPALAPPDPWRDRVRAFANPANQYWNATDWGPRPGKPDCQAPAEILAEFGFGGAGVIPFPKAGAA